MIFFSYARQEKNLSVTEFYIADEVFTTGTMGELTKVSEIAGRKIVNKSGVSTLEKIQGYFKAQTETGGTLLPF